MPNSGKTSLVFVALALLLAGVCVAFMENLPGRPAARPPIPLVDRAFLSTATVRESYADMVKAKEDLSDFDCYACHQKGKPPVLRYDENQKLIMAKPHRDIAMAHGGGGRSNDCFNCHDENNLLMLVPHDGRELKFSESTPLCGSCHASVFHDWQAGVHGRTSGYWDRALGPVDRKDCVSCHDPHAPAFPSRAPAPGPHTLHETAPAPATH
jgi:uncharacterized CHY-type Zn-finger protein